jgi:glutathione synthase/RimK-type ligase-like ATP-grasp enzyme
MVAHLREVCVRRDIHLTAFSGDWIFRLRKDGRTAHVFGYDFSLNSATAKLICKDKAAAAELLAFEGVPCIEHRIFHGPQLAAFGPREGSWSTMLACLAAHPQGIVCKPNEGTGGNAVFLVKTPPQLEAAAYHIFARSRSLCLSPFEEFQHEYRAAVLRGQVEFVYRKVRPALMGDGQKTMRELLLAHLAALDDFQKELPGLKALAEMSLDWERIPAAGESVDVNWRHNLGLGAQPELIDAQHSMWRSITELAVKAAHALQVDLASVDIAATPAGLKVLELNSGIMMENLIRLHPEGGSIAARFYERIVCHALQLPFAE